MGTTQNTAALYLRKSSLDDRSGDNRSISDQRHDLERLADRHGLQIVAEYEEKVGTSAPALGWGPVDVSGRSLHTIRAW
jgi:DNA invertase Pin-like site-specific DNA recombinase